MRSKAKILVPLMTFSLAWVLGCQGQDPVSHTGQEGGREPVAGREKAFESDLLALKAREQDPGRLEMGARELVARHGFAVPKDFRGGREGTGLIGFEAGLGTGEAPSVQPLAKAAETIQYFTVKDYTDPISGTFSQYLAVPTNATLYVETKRQGSTDPAIVAYYLGEGNDSAYTIKMVGLTNDNSGLDAMIKWKNTTGSTKWVRFVVFSPTAATVGTADVTVQVGTGTPLVHAAVPVAGRVYAADNLVANPGSSCPVHKESRISGTVVNFPAVNRSILMLGINALNNTGMEVMFGPTKSGSMPPLTNGLGGFLLAFQPMSKAGLAQISGSARVTQENGYLCL